MGRTGKAAIVVAVLFAWVALNQHSGSKRTTITSTTLGGELVPVASTRVLDTRVDGGSIRTREARLAKLIGVGEIPTGGVSAVAVNITVVNATDSGELRVFPSGTPVPGPPTMLFHAGRTVAHFAIVDVDAAGQVEMTPYAGVAGRIDVVIDVVGWLTARPSARGSRLLPLAPRRVVDTRRALGGLGPVGPGESVTVRVAGHGGVPESATAALVNVTIADPTEDTFVVAFPAGHPLEGGSTVNASAPYDTANLALVRLDETGKARFTNAAGHAHLVVDVLGAVVDGQPPTSVGGRIVSLVRRQVLDTRTSGGGPLIGRNPPTLTGSLSDIATEVSKKLHARLAGLLVEVTATGASVDTYVTVFPAALPHPETSTLNLSADQTVTNLALVRTSPPRHEIALTNYAGVVQVSVDVVGAVLAS